MGDFSKREVHVKGLPWRLEWKPISSHFLDELKYPFILLCEKNAKRRGNGAGPNDKSFKLPGNNKKWFDGPQNEIISIRLLQSKCCVNLITLMYASSLIIISKQTWDMKDVRGVWKKRHLILKFWGRQLVSNFSTAKFHPLYSSNRPVTPMHRSQYRPTGWHATKGWCKEDKAISRKFTKIIINFVNNYRR